MIEVTAGPTTLVVYFTAAKARPRIRCSVRLFFQENVMVGKDKQHSQVLETKPLFDSGQTPCFHRTIRKQLPLSTNFNIGRLATLVSSLK